MRPAAVPLLGYALLIGIIAAVQWVWSPYRLPAALLSGAALLMALIAGALAAGGRQSGDAAGQAQAQAQAIPDYSFATVAVAFGLCTLLVGAYLGLYLILIGGGVLLLGLGGLARELRAERRSVRRAREGGDAR